MLKKKIGKKGVTLVELIVAIGLLAIIMVAFLAMFQFGLFTVFFSGDRTEADYRALSIQDELYNTDYANISTVVAAKNALTDVDCVIVDTAGKTLNGSVVVAGTNIKTTVYYKNGNDKVEIFTFIPDPDQ